MNESQLQSRAARLLARHNKMGFTKNGKPMVIDQAFELVAAEEGHRNQHVLRATLADPKTVEVAEKEGLSQWQTTCLRMGWNEESQLIHLQGFLTEKGLMAEFGVYAQTVAKEELSLGNDEPSDAAVAALQAVGYKLATSDFGQPYWEFNDEGSTDFPSEEEAWAAAWEDALARTVKICGIGERALAALSEAERCSLVMEKLGEEMKRKAADDAFENHDFGAHLTVVGAGGWEWSGIFDQAIRTVFLQDTRTPEADSKAYRFMVDFVDGDVEKTTLYRPAIRG